MKKKCIDCGKEFKTIIEIRGKIKHLNGRKRCFECVPFGTTSRSKHAIDLYPYTIIQKKDGKQRCRSCNEVLPLDKFYSQFNKDYTKSCKECTKKYTIYKKQQRKQKIINKMGGKCQVCGYNKYLGALEFHHLDPLKKDITISENFSQKIILEEVKKCIILCSNCHRELHAGLINI